MDNEVHAHHISQQFNIELEEVKTHLLEMGGFVERQVNSAIEALVKGDVAIAQEVRDNDQLINYMEVSIDEECARILARRQPAAGDLRLILTISKANTDLERIGDEASKIARQAIHLSEQGQTSKGDFEIRHIGDHVREMVRNALDAFARLDAELALDVAREDKSVDREYKSAVREMVTYMMEDPRTITRVLNMLWTLRALERIGDHARNIAEYVIYLVKGKDVRHVGLKEMAARVHDHD